MGKAAFLLLLAAAVLFLGTAVGSVWISPPEALSALWGRLVSGGDGGRNGAILIDIRLPRVLLAFLAGGALSVSGAAVQSLLKNPLASPFTLGVSSGASLGAALVLATGFSLPFFPSLTLPAAGLFFGMGTVVLAVFLAQKADRSLESATIVLTGMAFSLFINAAVTMMAGLFPAQYERIIRWQAGSFSGRGWDAVKILLAVEAAGLIVMIFFHQELDLLTFGEEQAAVMGVPVRRVKWVLLLTASMLTGTAVAFSGVIGFADLIVPHVVRRLFGSRHAVVLPVSAAAGGVFMVLADLAARTLASPRELPVGAVTALLGAPFFAAIYLRKRAG